MNLASNAVAESLLDAFLQTNAAQHHGTMHELKVRAGESWDVSAAARHAHFIRAGLVSHSIGFQDGRAVSVHLSAGGELVELMEALTAPQTCSTALTITPTHIVRVPQKVVAQAFAEDAHFRSRAATAMGRYSSQTAQLAACHAVHDLESRLARYLYTVAQHTGSSVLITQETLALELAVRRTSVCSVMNHLRAHGVLEVSRGRITILDFRQLRRHACECLGRLAPGSQFAAGIARDKMHLLTYDQALHDGLSSTPDLLCA